ncbi:DUF2147 domain-containing protein [Niabella sp.]|uniref:DUF2147 domain-containing protein n=1 Tax=Niabella sp. TaxID=1962976 RepID=UPI002632FD77|nr:DUF2147 domain-containing protein [Niabella sp.]
MIKQLSCSPRTLNRDFVTTSLNWDTLVLVFLRNFVLRKIKRMRVLKISIVTVFLFLYTNAIAQPTGADQIIGLFVTEGGKGNVRINKAGNQYFGTLIWTNVPDAKDIHNPDKRKRNNKIAGTVILKNFVYTENNVWENGTVYDPESGKTCSGKITLKKNGSLQLRGFVGIAAFGRTTVWQRMK